MLNKAKICFAVVAVMAAAVPAGLLSADASTSAEASTAACGGSCTSPAVESTGDVLTVSGSSVDMSAASTSSTAQDWTVEDEGTVTDGVNAGILSRQLMLKYSGSALVEYQYAPGGSPSDKCLGDDSPINSYTTFYDPTLNVGLVQCGITAASLWIIDESNSLDPYDDLINAGYEASYTYLAPYTAFNINTNQNPVTSPFAEPYVLTASGTSVGLEPLSEIGGVISNTSQAWTAYTAPDQAALRAAIRKSARRPAG